MPAYKISIDRDLEDLVPAYLENRRKELPEFFALAGAGNFDQLSKAGHKLAGSGGGYGFDRLSELGRRLEELALAEDRQGLEDCLAALKDYLENLEITYS
ncbi:MAG: hypothetical protein A2049_10525 [Elusimicrobia bacterium GWA2_62_23]|nr:MAG: hypothetical protein A2049_10525 [Elusimicrobia bacterium GWA2_62_23]